MFGAASRAEFLKSRPSDISPPIQPDGQDSLSLGAAHFKWALENGSAHFEWVHRRANGEDFPAEVSFSAFDFQGRRILHSTVRDITERRRMESSLREREETFRAITESASDAIILMDSDGIITFWNPAAQKLFKCSPNEAIGVNLHQLLAPGRFHGAYLQSMPHFRESGECSALNRHHELSALNNEGREFPIELTVAPLRLRDQWHAVGIIRDITQRKKMDGEMLQARKEAESASRMKSAFLANMSHEIRTPMNGILGMATLLLNTEISLEQRDFIECLQRSAGSLLTILNDILDYSKAEAGRMELEKIDFSLRHCVEDVAKLLALRAQEKGLEFICLVDKDLPDYVCGDPGRIRQVLTNLLGNAIKFTERGEVSLNITTVSRSADHTSILCEIRDTGIGIDIADQKRLFQPFTQVDASTARRFGGTGLGLSITRQLVEMLGGTIGVESEIGRGSIFRFTLCLGRADSTPLLLSPIGELAGRRVLAVDDNESNRQLLHALLDEWGCDCEMASDASSALRMLQDAKSGGHPFDLALLDMQMPVTTGEDLGRLIKQDEALKGTRLVMITALGERGDARRLTQIGFSGYLSKPVRREQLRRCLQAVFGYSDEGSVIDPPLVTAHVLSEQSQGSRRVLVVEDNPVNQKVARIMIENLGFGVEMASNGKEALNALRSHHFDIVFMDCQMPEMDGYEATAFLRDPAQGALNPDVPVIAMTANAMRGDREKCLKAGMDDYVSKPVNPSELTAAIERRLGRLVRVPAARPAASTLSSPDNAKRASIAAHVQPPALEQTEFSRVNLLERLSGDEALATLVVRSFMKETQDQLAAFGNALAVADVGEARRLAHSMKGASGSVACPRLQDLAQRAETACRDGRLDDARTAGSEFFTAFANAGCAFRDAGLLSEEAR
jgi:PAS domain S-box-containing protein